MFLLKEFKKIFLLLFYVHILYILIVSCINNSTDPKTKMPIKYLNKGLKSIIKIDNIFCGSYINNNIARNDAIISVGDTQFFSYYDNNGRIKIAKRRLDKENFNISILPISPLPIHGNQERLDNPHNFISMTVDREGYIHLAYAMHNSKIKYIRSAKPFNIDIWDEEMTMLTGDGVEIRSSYPSFFNLKNGNIGFIFRSGSAGNGNTIIEYYNIILKEWSYSGIPLIEGDGENSQYFFSPIVSPDGCIHLAWTWRLSDFSKPENSPYAKPDFEGFTNWNISYAKSCDNGKTWENSSGKKYRLPLKRVSSDSRHMPEIIAEIPIGESFFNHYGADYDMKMNPHYVYYRWDKDKITQLWHLYFNGNKWVSSMISSYHKKIRWTRTQINGLASTDIARPEILIASDGRAIVISRSIHYNNRLEIYISDSEYSKWYLYVLNVGNLGGWEPQVDKKLFKNTERLQLLLNVITDKAIFERYNIQLSEKQLLILRKYIQGNKDIKYPDYSILGAIKQSYFDIHNELMKGNTGYLAEINYTKLIKETDKFNSSGK